MRTELNDIALHTCYAVATYQVDAHKYSESIAEEIAIGQSLGAWDTKFSSIETLKCKVAKILSIKKEHEFYFIEIAFPIELWHGQISFLLTLVFGKLSFYPGIQLNALNFSPACFSHPDLCGPRHTINSLRTLTHSPQNEPLLMGILKPNVALTSEQIAQLCVEAAEGGVHLVKDDEIRFDANEDEIIKRVERVSNEFAKRNLHTIYAVHLQVGNRSSHNAATSSCGSTAGSTPSNFLSLAKRLEDAGAKAFLLNTFVTGVHVLQELRRATDRIILSHPAFAGAFSVSAQSPVHPRVTYAQILRACGADLTLFPSPYGKIGLDKQTALDIVSACQLKNENWPIHELIPVPSAGIKPEHGPRAKLDFGNNFVLNAGTAIFATENSIQKNISDFRKALYAHP